MIRLLRLTLASHQASPVSISLIGVITQKRFRKNSKPLSKPRRFFPNHGVKNRFNEKFHRLPDHQSDG